MKKKNFKKLSLNKKGISNLETIVAGDDLTESICFRCPTRPKSCKYCFTEDNYGSPCSVAIC